MIRGFEKFAQMSILSDAKQRQVCYELLWRESKSDLDAWFAANNMSALWVSRKRRRRRQPALGARDGRERN